MSKNICCETMICMLKSGLLAKNKKRIYLKGFILPEHLLPEKLRVPFRICPYCGKNLTSSQHNTQKRDKFIQELKTFSKQVDEYLESEGLILVNR